MVDYSEKIRMVEKWVLRRFEEWYRAIIGLVFIIFIFTFYKLMDGIVVAIMIFYIVYAAYIHLIAKRKEEYSTDRFVSYLRCTKKPKSKGGHTDNFGDCWIA